MDNNKQVLLFKTNINCSGCVAAVQPHLDRVVSPDHWEVDTTSKDKILTVAADDTTAQEIIAAVEQAGYRIEALNK